MTDINAQNAAGQAVQALNGRTILGEKLRRASMLAESGNLLTLPYWSAPYSYAIIGVGIIGAMVPEPKGADND